MLIVCRGAIDASAFNPAVVVRRFRFTVWCRSRTTEPHYWVPISQRGGVPVTPCLDVPIRYAGRSADRLARNIDRVRWSVERNTQTNNSRVYSQPLITAHSSVTANVPRASQDITIRTSDTKVRKVGGERSLRLKEMGAIRGRGLSANVPGGQRCAHLGSKGCPDLQAVCSSLNSLPSRMATPTPGSPPIRVAVDQDVIRVNDDAKPAGAAPSPRLRVAL